MVIMIILLIAVIISFVIGYVTGYNFGYDAGGISYFLNKNVKNELSKNDKEGESQTEQIPTGYDM